MEGDRLVMDVTEAMEFGLGRKEKLVLSISDSQFIDFICWQLGKNKHELPIEFTLPKRLPLSSSSNKNITLMYSGGLDSTIAYHYAIIQYGVSNIRPIHVNYGAPYSGAEGTIVNTCLRIPHYSMYIPLRTMKEKELDKGYIIPLRNTLLAAIGSLYSDNVWIIAHYRYEPYVSDGKDRGVSDKGVQFFNRVSEVLSRLRRTPIRVWSPFQHLSKTDCILWARNNLPREQFNFIINNTITCYNPIEINSKFYNCGRCYTCWKLARSFLEVIGVQGNFAKDPFDDPNIREYEEREKNKGR